jgi:hypothetical protein
MSKPFMSKPFMSRPMTEQADDRAARWNCGKWRGTAWKIGDRFLGGEGRESRPGDMDFGPLMSVNSGTLFRIRNWFALAS